MARLRLLKGEASDLLAAGRGRVGLVLCGAALVFFCFFGLMLAMNVTGVVFGAAEGLPVAEALIFWGLCLLGFLAVMPTGCFLVYRGAYRLFLRDARGLGATEIPRVSLDRAFLAGALMLLRPLAVLFLFGGFYLLARATGYVLYLPLMTLAGGLSYLLLWGSGGWFLVPYLTVRGLGGAEAVRGSCRMMRRYRSLYGAYLLSFLGLVLLSLLTVGVLLLLYTVPLMLYTYFLLADHLVGHFAREELIREQQ